MIGQEDQKTLIVGLDLNRDFETVKKHIYVVALKNGMGILASVKQQNMGLTIDIYAPNGEHIKQLARPRGKNATKQIDYTANETGQFKFVINAQGEVPKNGSYQLKIDAILSLEDNSKRIAKKELPTSTLYKLWEAS